MNPDLDLTLQRVIRAPRAAVWRAWTDPALLAQWWVPAPTVCRVDRLEVRPGGAFVTQMSDDGVDVRPAPRRRLPRRRRARAARLHQRGRQRAGGPPTPDPVAMTAEIMLGDHPDGTDYRVVVRHGDPAARARHEELGFFDGWGSVTGQLAALVEGAAR